MGSKGIGLLFMFFSHLCIVIALSSSPIHQENSSSDFMQDKNSRGRSTYEQSSKGGFNGSDTVKNSIEHSNKIEHGIGHGTAHGGGTRPTNPGDNNGGSRTPSQGGTTFIPAYAAGAANNRHPYHRGAANSNQVGVLTLIAATLGSLLHLYLVFRCG